MRGKAGFLCLESPMCWSHAPLTEHVYILSGGKATGDIPIS